MAAQNCKEIEKHIKDLLFKNSIPVNESLVENDSCVKSSDALDDRCLVSNIEENSHTLQNINSSFAGLNSVKDNLNQSGVSELIDLNVLTNFAAKHIDDANFNTSDMVLNCKQRVLPHPELEDNITANNEPKPSISVLFDNISKEIQNSSNFLSLPEKPLPQTHVGPSKSAINNGCSDVIPGSKLEDQFLNERKNQKKKKKSQKKLEKEKRIKDRMNRIYVPNQDSANLPEISDKDLSKEANTFNDKVHNSVKKSCATPEKKTASVVSENFPDIKLKKTIFSSSGREYSLSFIKGSVKFQCYVCNQSANSRDATVRHLNSKAHREIKDQNDLMLTLPFLPEPLEGQVRAVTELLMHIVMQFGLQKEDLLIRENLATKIKMFVKNHVTEGNVDLIGSSVTGVGLKTSKVDFVLRVPAEDSIPDALENLYKALCSDSAYANVVADFKKKQPRILYTDKEEGLECNVVIDNGSSVKLANLLSTYSKLDDRVCTLGVALRHWARICEIDNQDCGTLPSFSYGILLVHFLQQVEPPVLPVLHEVKEFASTPDFYAKYVLENRWHSQNTDSVGELWIKFFKYYCLDYKLGEDVVCIRTSKKVSCSDRNWSTKFFALEDPFGRRNLAYVIPTYQVCQYIQQCFLKTYIYFAYPKLKQGSIKLLKTDLFNSVICDYALNKPLIKGDTSEDSEASDNEEESFLNSELNFNEHLEDHDPDISVQELVSTVTNLTLEETERKENDIASEVSKESTAATSDMESGTSVAAADDDSSENKDGNKLQKEKQSKSFTKSNLPNICNWDVGERDLNSELFYYEFDVVTLRGEKSVPLICRSCKSSGHQKKDCPNDQLPPPCSLPEMTPEYLRIINKALYYIRDRNVVNDNDMKYRVADMRDIEGYIRKVFPDATLSLFGSFCNGFGFKNRSDMDFCLTFGDRDDGKDLDCTNVIEKVAEQLRQHPDLENIVPVTSAKVPIVKFASTRSGLEGDISLYNTLALANTEMLEAYSKIDPRVQILGFALKYFAKILGICDASRGSLSSYAYILMVIFFLQQRKPPVIPVLQELFTTDEKPSELIDGWNVWFFKDIDKLNEVWPDYGKNKENVAELWLGLLSFYACEFDWREYVISIRQADLLLRFRKLWNTDQIAIEDPFDLNHNLGAGLSRKMNSYIFKAFLRGRERFGTPLPLLRMNTIQGHEVGYLFDRRFLSSGSDPPHDRGCRNCGKIGHIAKNCPQEKTCSFCGKTGHLVKNCPKKNKWKRSKENEELSNQDHFPVYEKRNEKQNHRATQQRNQINDLNVMSNVAHNIPANSDDRDGVRKLMQLGIPAHRFPPPGFPQPSRAFMSNAPPGFMPNLPSHQNMNYPPPFSAQHPRLSSPFPRSAKMNDVLSQSPPKHYSSSPPKNFSNKSFHQMPESSWSMGGRTNLQSDRHPSSQDRHAHAPWQNRPQVQRDILHHQSNQFQNLDHRLKRTNSDNPYNSNHLDRWK